MGSLIRSSLHSVTEFSRATLALALPASCVLCRAELDSDLHRVCSSCVGQLSVCRAAHACPRCAMPVAVSAASSESAITDCIHCRKLPCSFARTVAFGRYEGALRDAVILAKQASHRAIAEELAALAVHANQPLFSSIGIDLVAGVPSHWMRRLKRKGTPAQILATAFARALRLPWKPVLVRHRRTEKQGTLTLEQRRKNVDGSFAVNSGYVFRSTNQSLRGKHVLVVDDVMTTGATGNAAATALRLAGASEVTVAVIARASG